VTQLEIWAIYGTGGFCLDPAGCADPGDLPDFNGYFCILTGSEVEDSPVQGPVRTSAGDRDPFVMEMNLVEKRFALLVLILLGMVPRVLVAQEGRVPDPYGYHDELPPQIVYPQTAGQPYAESTSLADLQARANSSSAETIDTGSEQSLLPYTQESDYRLVGCEPALLESTGTWLRRGFWYTEVDAVVFNRAFKEATILLAQEVNQQGNFFQTNDLFIGGSRPGAEGMPRVMLGRFLFRDADNRDHTAEFTAYGGGEWTQQGSLSGTFLQIPFERDGFNPSFNGATLSQYRHDTRFNSFELNYHVKQRLGRDRMELEPNGAWVRRGTGGVTQTFLAGIRYVDITDILHWDAFGIPDANNDNIPETGIYQVRTDNDLFGTQVGYSAAIETARWSLGVLAKGGGYLNELSLDSDFSVTGDVTSGTARGTDDTLSFVGEVRLQGKWHIRPNLSLRTSFEMVYINSLALSPFQVNFVPGVSTSIAQGGENTYLGGAVGIEGYW